MALVAPSGDTTGVTDVAAINAVAATTDTTLSAGGIYYIKADASGNGIKLGQGITLSGESALNKSIIRLVGTSSSTQIGIAITGSGNGTAKNNTVKNIIVYGGRNGTQSTLISFTAATKTISISAGYLKYRGYTTGDTITISGSASNNGNYTVASITDTTVVVSEALVNESAGATVNIFKSSANGITGSGSCITFAGHNDYGTNAISLIDVELYDGPTQQCQINSIDGLTLTRVIAGYTISAYPTAASHGFDFDAVAHDKPIKNVVSTDCTFDAYGQDSLKHENCETVTHTRATINGYVSLVQDGDIPYSDLSGVSFVSCTMNSWVSLANLKRRHTPAGSTTSSTPAATLTLGSNLIGTGIAVTASAGVFSAGDVNKGFEAVEGGISGFAVITGFTDSSHVTIQIYADFFDTSVASGWRLAATDNGGSGDVTFTSCTFTGDDALIMGLDNNYPNYGTLTVTNCTFTGKNSVSVPNGVYPVLSGNVGIDPQKRITLWTRNNGSAGIIKYQSVLGTTGGLISRAKSVGLTTAQGAFNTAIAQVNNRFNWTDFRNVFVNDTYTHSVFSFTGFASGNSNVRYSIEAETKWRVIWDGTSSASQAFGFTGTNTQLVTVSGIYVQNFRNGTSSRAFLANAATAVVNIVDCYFYNCSTTSNGGSAIRIQGAQSALIYHNVFDTCVGVTGGNGGAVLCDVINCYVEGNLFTACGAAGTGAGVLRLNATVAGSSYATGNVFLNCTAATTTPGISVSTPTAGVTFNICNNAFYGNSAPTTPQEISIFVNNATATCNCSNNIAYSSGMTNNIVKTGSGVMNYGNNCTPGAISVASGTNNNLGGNITTDPAFTSLTTLKIGTTSPCYQTGSNLTSQNRAQMRDRNSRPFVVPLSMGAYELNTNGQLAAARTAATTRSAATRTAVPIARTARVTSV